MTRKFRIQNIRFSSLLVASAWIALLTPKTFGIIPSPDGCYPNFTTAEGCKALQSLTTGVANSGIGWYSLFGTSTGSYNTAVGAGALDLNNADYNTAVGVAALLLNTSGINNTATGTGALVFNDTGEGNTATGAFALYSNTDGQFNTANGEFTLYFNTIGERNTAIGDSALYLNTSGNRNTAIGNPAMLNNTNGSDNTAVGAGALFSNNGDNNTAVGADALSNNTTGSSNVAVGNGALLANAMLNNNTAVGFQALANNVGNSGNGLSDNTAVGASALLSNITGFDSTAIGVSALKNNTDGAQNTAVGVGALRNNTSGNINTAIGYRALVSNTTGGNNIAVGDGAGEFLTTGNSNIDIGNSGIGGDTQTIRIGGLSQIKTFIAGISGVTVSGGTAVFINTDGQLGTSTSSARFKDEIKPMDKASELLFSLQPVTFRYKKELDATGAAQFGLVAEEVEKVCPDLIVRDKKGNAYTVRYDQVNAMLLNEFLKEHRAVQAQQKEIDALKQEVKEQRALIEKVNSRMDKASPQRVADSL